MLSVREARDAILTQITPLGTERVSLLDASGRILAEEIRALRQQPPWDNSAMDGYALRAADSVLASEEAPVRLTVVEDLMAGAYPTREVGPGQAARIMTGAPVPSGADAVLRVEQTRSSARDQVEILASVPVGNDIRRAGEDQQVGDILASPGTLLRAAEIGVIASAPRAFVRVQRQPVVAILATGDELAEPDQPIAPGQIVNTNAYALAAMVREAGAIPRLLPVASDALEPLKRAILEARGADVLLSTGGVSVGEHDFVKEALTQLGVKMDFWKVKMTPGKPLAFGLWDTVPVFGLPGNPVSSMVTFELFVRPALLKLAGHTRIFRRMVRAKLAEAIPKREGFVHFLRVRLEHQAEGLIAHNVGAQGSGVLRSMSRANALAVGEEPLKVLPAGLEVWVMPLDHQHDQSDVRPV